jgi:glucosylceramidase
VVPIELTAIRKKYSMGDLASGFLRVINSGCQSITVWNLALDPEGYPNVGPFNCRGTVEIGRDGKTVKRSDEFHVLQHFSRYIERGAKRIILDEIALPRNFEAAAFKNPDGSRVVLISNTDTWDSDLCIRDGDRDIPLHVLRESINTALL